MDTSADDAGSRPARRRDAPHPGRMPRRAHCAGLARLAVSRRRPARNWAGGPGPRGTV